MPALIVALVALAVTPPADAWAAAPWDHAAAWVFEQQRDFHRQLADALRHLASGDAAIPREEEPQIVVPMVDIF
ncbi:MAG: hypothetical protein AB1918_01575, partial [Pseudomonadota bacterium]